MCSDVYQHNAKVFTQSLHYRVSHQTNDLTVILKRDFRGEEPAKSAAVSSEELKLKAQPSALTGGLLGGKKKKCSERESDITIMVASRKDACFSNS